MSTPARPLDPREADPLTTFRSEYDILAGKGASWAEAEERFQDKLLVKLDAIGAELDRARWRIRRNYVLVFLAGVVIGLAAGVCGAVVFR